MIATEKIVLTNKDLFNILVKNYLRKRWWMFAWIWVMIVLLLLRENNDSISYFIVVALILLQFLLIYQYWGYANSNENNERYFEIQPDKIVGITADGASTIIETSQFRSVVQTSKYFLLYTSKTEFIYLPINCFKTNEDLKWFESEIVEKIK